MILSVLFVSCSDDQTITEQVCTKYAKACGADSSELQQWVDECVYEYRATPEEAECILDSSTTSCDEIEECVENGIF